MKLYIKEQEHYRTDAIFFLIGLVLFFPLFAFGLWFGHTGYNRIGQMFACGFQRVTGFPCPGCGGTRAFYYLFRGEFFKSFLYHPAVLYGMGAYLEYKKNKQRNSNPVLFIWSFVCYCASVGC